MSISGQDDMYNDRKILLLEDKNDKSIKQLLSILCSPLGLAKELADRAFSKDSKNGLLSYADKLDILKRMAVGLESASRKSSYPISDYASYLFAFQQFFHSSYRARQGNFAESLVRSILTLSNKVKVYKKTDHPNQMALILSSKTESNHDMDVMARSPNEYLFVQIRSRDDTGGTTAKGSLVEFLKDIIRNNNSPKYKIRYVIFIWIPGAGSQKSSLISKIVDQLTNLHGIIPEKIRKQLENSERIILVQNITLELVYGFEDFSRILGEFSRSSEIAEISNKVFKTLEDWDDLWLTYVVTSIEIQNLRLKGKNNFQILEEKLIESDIKIDSSDFTDYKKESYNVADRLIKIWKEDTLPVSSPRDQFLYIRDLVLIKMMSLAGSGNSVKPGQSRKVSKGNPEENNEAGLSEKRDGPT